MPGPETAVLTATNGIPWWYFYKAGTPYDGRQLDSVDPGARQWNAIQPKRAIGCVVEPACEIVAPGIIAHRQFKRWLKLWGNVCFNPLSADERHVGSHRGRTRFACAV